AYRITLLYPDGRTDAIDATVPTFTLSRASRISGVELAVRQVGAHGESNPARIAIPGWIF
ncbi:MAG: hypothetical protein WCS75_03310, partial [Sphingomonas sp.]